MKKIQWGIIGCGDVTEVKSGPAFRKVNDSDLVAVMRRNPAKAEDYARRHSVPRWYSNAQQLIDDPEVNAVYIATPPQSHEAYTVQCLAAGKPVYVEKPMATDAAAASRMQAASLSTGKALSVAHYRREQPRFKKVKALLEEKAIGEVRLVSVRLVQPPQSALIAKTDQFWRVDPAVSGGGLFNDLAPHQLDLLQYFFGEVATASGQSMNQAGLYAADDLVTGSVIFKNGVLATGYWCFTGAAQEEQDTIEIIGSEGSIRFSTFTTHSITVTKKGEGQQIHFDELQHVQQPMIDAVVKYFLGTGPNPCTPESGVETMRILDAFTGKYRFA